jgi:Zn-dependent protease with chaperone function
VSAAEFEAIYFDGRTSARTPVLVRLAEGRLHVFGPQVALEAPLHAVRMQAPIAGERHLLALPGGAQLQTDDAPAVLAIFGAAADSWVRHLEGRWRFAVAAVAVIIACGAWAFVFGVPMAAEHIAARLPASVSERLGAQALGILDSGICGHTGYSREVQAHLRNVVLPRLVAGLPGAQRYTLALRRCPSIGANAFALPGSTIVVTDELLLALNENDEQVAAVLAHEVGHVRKHHPVRLTLQAAGVAALVGTLANDAVSITNLAAALPVVLLNTGYSRAFEDEADGFAIERLRAVGISPARLAEALELIEKSHAERVKKASGLDFGRDYLSTHPDTAQRIERAQRAAHAPKANR